MDEMKFRKFNVTGLCVPDKHYMADVSDKISQIEAMVEQGNYFTINRARQYGKTTTLFLLEKKLIKDSYEVIKISFEAVSDNMFETEEGFCQGLLKHCANYYKERNLDGAEAWVDSTVDCFDKLRDFITKICNEKKLVLMIDETDKSSNNVIFLKFLGLLRDKYLKRNEGIGATFQSVILAGVYNIKNLKLKMIQAGTHELQDGEKRINSPWNIAADFNVDMSLNVKEISSMLIEYENDHKTGMDIESIANEIRTYTNGYPYLVSRICQIIDDDASKDWTVYGVEKAIKRMLNEKTTLIDDIAKNLYNYKELNDMMFNIIAKGQRYKYNSIDITMDIGLTFGFLIKQNDDIIIGNKFFELLFYIHYSQKLETERNISRLTIPSDVIINNKLNMQLVIEKFARHYFEIYKNSLKKFIEDECRMLFITYLQPLINGTGFYHIESETRDSRRMDVVIDYGSEQFIVELKLWYGDASHDKALEQIAGYLDSKNKDTGYLLTFDFRKENNTGSPINKWIEYNSKNIFDCIVGL